MITSFTDPGPAPRLRAIRCFAKRVVAVLRGWGIPLQMQKKSEVQTFFARPPRAAWNHLAIWRISRDIIPLCSITRLLRDGYPQTLPNLSGLRFQTNSNVGFGIGDMRRVGFDPTLMSGQIQMSDVQSPPG